jgi:hypothetical protein
VDGTSIQHAFRGERTTRRDGHGPNFCGLAFPLVGPGGERLGAVVLDFVFWMHFIKPVYVVEAFEPGRAGILIAVTGLVGYVIGGAFTLLWNRLNRHATPPAIG